MSKQKDGALIIFEGTDQLIEQTIAELKKSTITDEALASLKEQYGGMIIAGIEDMKGYKAVKAAVTQLRTIRTSIEGRRKELTEPALKFQREVKAEADRITAEIKPLEERLKEQVINIDDAREAARKAEYQRRLTLFTESGYQYINGFFVCGPVQVLGDQLVELTDEQLEFHINHGKAEIARIQAENERKQQEEIQRKAEDERLRLERETLEKEKAEFAAWKAKQQEEINAQTKAIEKTYDTVVQPEPSPVVVTAEPDPAAVAHPEEYRQAWNAKHPDMAQPAPTAEKRPVSFGPEYMAGFGNFRIQLIGLMNSPEKINRAGIIEWAKNLQPIQ
jgi:hypothetical protein